MAKLTLSRRRTDQGFLIFIGCTACQSWDKLVDPQSPIWQVLIVYGDHLALRHGFQDDAIARAQAKTGYDKDYENLELPACD